jgi:iron-sulfur cluster assembly protein
MKGETISMAITITEKAAGEIKRVMSEQNMAEQTILRIGVTGGGCGGFMYAFGFDDKTDTIKDLISEQHGLTVAVDKKSELFLDGTTIDFHDAFDRRGFTFDNPNSITAGGGCAGCSGR